MTVSPNLTNLFSALEAEKTNLRIFIEILEREENALIQGKIEEIDHIASDKSRMIEKLFQFDEYLREQLYNQALAFEENNINIWIDQRYSGHPEIQISWNELLELVRIAQKLTHSNGIIISNCLQHNQHAFAALHCAAGNIFLYGPKGQACI
jgi:flagella synthesis protein FlgN